MKSQRQKDIKKLDDLCKKIVRLRDKNTCQHCGKHVNSRNSHVSHVIPKSKGYALRWDLRNLKLLCFHCHINWWHKNIAEAWMWFQREFPYRADYLLEHKDDIIFSKDRKEFMENKLKELEEIWKKLK